MHFIYNGKLYEEGTPIVGPASRGLRYGDGLFETIRCRDGKPVLLDEHFARLWTGMQLLQFEIPRLFSPDKLQDEIMTLLKKNNLSNARIRINVVRGDGGLYDSSNRPNYIIEATPLTGDGKWNENGLVAGVYYDARKTADKFSSCKHNSFLPYCMAALYAKKEKLNDAIVLNQHERVCDSTIANIFIIKNGSLITPPLSEGCVAGIIRKQLIQILPSLGYTVNELPVTVDQLLEADEAFLTNSIFNMRWLAQAGNTKYDSKECKVIYKLLADKLPHIF